MKTTKRIALLIIIFILTTTFSTYAADYATPTTGVPDITLTASATQVKVGDEVTITISAKCDTGVGEFNCVLEYDDTKVKLTSVENHEYYLSLSGNDGEKQLISLVYGNALGTEPAENPTEVTEFVKLKFEVLDTAVVGDELNIKLSEIEFYDGGEGEFYLEDEETTLTVVTENSEDPKDPADPEDPKDPVDPEDPKDPVDPEDPKDPADPENPKDPANPEKPKDPTIADKPINNAGLATYGFIVMIIAIASIVLYTKCNKYEDVK